MTYRIPGRLAAATLLGLLTVAAPRVHAQTPVQTPPAQQQQKPKVTVDSAAGSVQTPAPTPKAAAPAAGAKAGACTVKLDATPIAVAPSPVTLQAAVTGALGDSVAATVAPESKISVVSVKPGAAGLELILNTSQAVPGEYTISFKGSNGECATKLKVGAAEKH